MTSNKHITPKEDAYPMERDDTSKDYNWWMIRSTHSQAFLKLLAPPYLFMSLKVKNGNQFFFITLTLFIL